MGHILHDSCVVLKKKKNSRYFIREAVSEKQTLRRLVADYDHQSKYFFVSLEPKIFSKCHKFLVRPTNCSIENKSLILKRLLRKIASWRWIVSIQFL